MQKTKLMKLLNIFLSILILLILIVYYSSLKTIMDYDIELQRITILAIIIVAYCLVTSMLCKSKITNLSIIYIVFYMIFIFGSFIARFCFNFNEENTEALYKMIDPYYLVQAGILSIYCLLGIHIGAAIASYTTKQAELKEKEEVIDKEIVIKTIRRVSAILLVISTLSAIITFYNNAILAYQGGYSAVYSTTSYGINSLHEKLEPFFYVGLLLLMVSYKEQRKKANIVFTINLLYNGVQIFFRSKRFAYFKSINVTFNISFLQ